MARALRLHVGEKFSDDVELVVAREDLARGFLAGARVFGDDDLGVVLDDVGQARRSEGLPPQVVGLQSVRVGRVAGAVVPALVEGEEPGLLALEVRAEPDLLVIKREVGDASAELEEQVPRVAVALVLHYRVVEGLLGDVVLQLERKNRKPVHERHEVKREPGGRHAVVHLPGDREPVGREQLSGPRIAGRRRREEQVHVMLPVIHALAKHVDDPVAGDLALEARQELMPRRRRLAQ